MYCAMKGSPMMAPRWLRSVASKSRMAPPWYASTRLTMALTWGAMGVGGWGEAGQGRAEQGRVSERGACRVRAARVQALPTPSTPAPACLWV